VINTLGDERIEGADFFERLGVATADDLDDLVDGMLVIAPD